MNDTTFHLFGSTFCCMIACMVLAAGAGLFGVIRARKLGAPGSGPQVLAGSMAVLAAAGLAQLLLMVAMDAMTRNDLYPLSSILVLLVFLFEVVGMAGVAAGVWLLRPLPRSEEGTS